jgi:hypothetical protein
LHASKWQILPEYWIIILFFKFHFVIKGNNVFVACEGNMAKTSMYPSTFSGSNSKLWWNSIQSVEIFRIQTLTTKLRIEN